ncbi:2-hydroxyacid dehydrogenase [Roseinatronobacter alkalisoli]|uniref:Glyoxylate/hydroxypyruvate reductase A n=1 Tax=Roseinatronobacter alkalisoli TaxID=3028235 RepID=A0ABT5T5Q4_9RHOB|nr:glyoxylate/hydroxypyruvate reductase A [Roseinatronobacter sp. HJB301]MDD7970433.1 glyoxylate/hydroxypyruvate reductase A [Roseinatronobacter sp. HJB301]
MTLTVLFAAGQDLFNDYHVPLANALKDNAPEAVLVTEAAPETVDYIIYAPSSVLQDFTPYTRCKAVLNLWAGVEKIVGNPTLTQPLCRMVDPALTQGMVEYVSGHALRHHLGMDAHIHARPGDWNPVDPPLAQDRSIAILGLGALGQAVAKALSAFGFQMHGWARGPKSVPGMTCHHGPTGLTDCLSRAEILVTLLPLTPDTENLLDTRALAILPEGAALINPGRGGLVDDTALIAALDSGHISHATLDVFRTEPLPADHPFWAHPRVTVTPHIAATTRPHTAAQVIAQNIARSEMGQPLLNLVDRSRGY